ncbi:MAG: hypothetical protein HKP30_17365 [Myxococcales bacterium]|nr:hypothetical protein [Myxococcales bacterium]
MRRALRIVAIVLIALLLIAAIVLVPRAVGMAEVGVGYVAKQVCSCLYVAERALEACRADLLPSMDRIQASVLPDRQGVRASLLGGRFERTALRDPDGGCTLQ